MTAPFRISYQLNKFEKIEKQRKNLENQKIFILKKQKMNVYYQELSCPDDRMMQTAQ